MRKFIPLIILLMVCSVFSQTNDEERLAQINQNLASAYQSGKVDEALELARQSLDLSLKIFGAEKKETAIAYTNLGVISGENKKFKESIENLQNALRIYQKDSANNGREISKGYEKLAQAYLLADKKKEAEENLLKSLEINERVFGKDNGESFSIFLSLANFYAYSRDYDKADEFYLKSYASAVKKFGAESKEIERLEDSRTCLYSAGSEERAKERGEKFFERKNAILGVSTDVGVINGKATFLAKPAFPFNAKARGVGGRAILKVKVDESGDVIQAKFVCGNRDFEEVSRTAALSSKFSPTLKDGKPIIVQGYIVYNFLAR